MKQMRVMNQCGSTNKLTKNMYNMSNVWPYYSKIDKTTNNMMISGRINKRCTIIRLVED